MLTNPHGTARYSPVALMTLCLAATLFLGGILTPLHAQGFETKLLASDGAAEDWFGHSLSIDNDWAIVGASYDDDNGDASGSAYIFRWNGTDWVEEAKLAPSDGAANDQFGISVSIDNNRAIIGAYRHDTDGNNSGAAYIYKWNGAAWVQEAKLTPSDGTNYHSFGIAVSIDDGRAIIGAYSDNSAYIFTWNGSDWVEEAKLLAGDGAASDYFGWSVSIDSDRAIVGAYYDNDNGDASGSAYIFTWNGTDWVQEAKLTASDGAAEDYFGRSVSIANDWAIIGAPWDDADGNLSGSAYIFTWNGAAWVETAKLAASDGAAYNYFGHSVSIYDDRAIIGAYGSGEVGNLSGSAYIFKWNGVAWVETAKLAASDGSAGEWFGITVAIDSNRAIISALHDGANGFFSGSAYIYQLQLPFADYSATSLAFNNVPFGEQAELTFSVKNMGLADLIVSHMFFTVNGYSATPDTFTLSHGQSQLVTVTFAPDFLGAYEGELVITYNSPSSPDTISLSGTGALPGAYIDYLASFTVLPSYVNVMFQVTDQDGIGLTMLNDVVFYDIEENGSPISDTEALPKIGQMDQVPFKVKTVLMLDNSFSIGLDLGTLKTAALAVVDNILPQQEIAVFTFSETIDLLQDLTHDVDLLTAAINGISLGPASTNLYGAVIAGANHAPDIFSPEKIEQSYLIILTDGQDTQGSATLAEALAARNTMRVITIGVGAGADVNVLEQIQTVGYFPAADFSELLQVFEDIQQRIIGLANSFYWLVYVSPTRGANEHTLEIGLKNNPNTGAKSTISVNFSSDGFSSVLPGVYVNRSFDRLNGIDSVAFDEGSASTLLTAETLFSLYTPVYEWASGNPGIITVVPVEGDPTQAVVNQVGQIGQSTTITVSDVANSYSKVLYVIVSTLNLAVEYGPGLPAEFTLHQNYPNPFNPSTTIQFDLQAATEVHLAVYDLLGREVARLVSGYLEAGYRQVIWNGRDINGRELPSGIYIARLLVPSTAGVTPEYARSVKMLLLR